MTFFDDDPFATDERGLNGFERNALDFIDGFLERLMQGARVYRLSGQDVMTLNQARQVLLDFGNVDFDGHLRISAQREDRIGYRASVLEITSSQVVIGVQGSDMMETGGEAYHDIYFSVGDGQESDTLDDDLDAWETEFFDKLTFPDAKVTVEGEIFDIRERGIDDGTESEDTPEDYS
ncbi:MAG: hypothetical protein RL213_882 [Bacteroidota bacterium]|jgi:hypothetical protein